MAHIPCSFCGFGWTWKIRRDRRKCKRCRREFNPSTYPVKTFRCTSETWKNAISTFLRERTEKRIAEAAGASINTAQKMAHHLREKMFGEIPDSFHGPVEMDETYIGGQRKNKRLHIRRIKGKRGHGTEKLPIVGLFDRKTGSVFVVVEPKKLDMAFITSTVKERVLKGSAIYTDGFKMYRNLPKHGYIHEFVDHAGEEYVRGEIHTNNIEGFWGILKRKMGCIGGMRREHLHLFVAEIVWKFNHRNESLEDQERALMRLVLSR